MILYRAGRTAQGAAASASHTASVAGDYTVTRELALRSGVGITASMKTLDGMCTAGEVCKPCSVRRPGVKRPVPVYALAEVQSAGETASTGVALQSALAAWHR